MAMFHLPFCLATLLPSAFAARDSTCTVTKTFSFKEDVSNYNAQEIENIYFGRVMNFHANFIIWFHLSVLPFFPSSYSCHWPRQQGRVDDSIG